MVICREEGKEEEEEEEEEEVQQVQTASSPRSLPPLRSTLLS